MGLDDAEYVDVGVEVKVEMKMEVRRKRRESSVLARGFRGFVAFGISYCGN